VWDRDFVMGDDLIGEDTIDLEDRWYSEDWKNIGKEWAEKDKELDVDAISGNASQGYRPKPVERRTLHNLKRTTTSQGSLTLWIDILTPAEAKMYPAWDISPPPPEEYDVRVVAWKCKGVKSAAREVSCLMRSL